MKRFVSLFLSLMLLLSCVVPVSATTTDLSTSNFINITSFCSETYKGIPAGGTHTFSFTGLPYGDYVYIDCIVYTGAQVVPTNTNLQKFDLGNGYYRIYGYNSAYASSTVSLTVKNNGTTSSEFFIYKCLVSTSTFLERNLFKGIYATNNIDSFREESTTPSSSVYVTFNTNFDTPPQNNIRQYYTYLYTENYHLYDYIDFNFTLDNIYSIDSIVVKSNNGHIFPFTINYVTSPNGSIILPDESPSFADFVNATHSVNVSIRVDLRSSQRIVSNDYEPFVMIRGQWLSGNTLNTNMRFTCNSFVGYIDTSGYSTLDLFLMRITNYLKDGFSNVVSTLTTGFSNVVSTLTTGFSNVVSTLTTGFSNVVSTLTTGFTNISNKLSSIITGRTQDQTAADSFNDSIDDQSNELEDLTGDLNSVTRPPLSDVNLSSSGMVNSNTIVLATTGIGSIMSNTIILRVLLMALTFALAGFILYGKR